MQLQQQQHKRGILIAKTMIFSLLGAEHSKLRSGAPPAKPGD